MSLRTRSSASAVRSSARRKEASPQHREPRESSTRGRTRKNPRSPSGSPSISEAQLREGAARESGNSQRDASLNSAYAEPMEDVEELTPPPETSSESEDQGHDLPRRLSPAEKAREKRLQADRMVRIHNPRLVQCRRCDTYIKLSAKSQFDLAHWRTHRERCLRRSDSMVAELKGTNDKKQLPSYSQDTTVSRTSRRRVPSTTPSLTPETDGSGPSSTVSAIEPKSAPRSESPLLLEELTPPPPTPPSTPPPPPPPSSRVPTQRALDPAFEEYLARSQRRPTSQVSPRLFTSWQDWRWSRLRAPVWLPHETRPGSVDASGAYGLDMDEDDDMPSKFALSACRDEPYHPTAPV